MKRSAHETSSLTTKWPHFERPVPQGAWRPGHWRVASSRHPATTTKAFLTVLLRRRHIPHTEPYEVMDPRCVLHEEQTANTTSPPPTQPAWQAPTMPPWQHKAAPPQLPAVLESKFNPASKHESGASRRRPTWGTAWRRVALLVR